MKTEIPFTPRSLVVLLLSAATLAVYWPAQHYAFVNFDDGEYVYENPHVTAGPTGENIRWAFTKTHSANWHPLTWISHMIDCRLYGLEAGGHHVTNIFLHLLNTLLLFFLLRRMTGALWRSALVAALFALHPLHVESVAWVAERKDVLSALFLFLTVGAYVRYVKRPGIARYGLVAALFAGGLMAKPMLVTLPALLLILDFWPLGRLRRSAGEAADPEGGRSFMGLFAEKLPLAALSLVSSCLTIMVQDQFNAMPAFAFHDRIANAVISYASYCISMFFPRDLCVFYPFKAGQPLIAWAGAAVFIGLASFIIVRKRRFPWLAAGWLWYLVSLVPVIGIIQVGLQGKADRYTYIPLIGLFIVVAWGAHALSGKFPKIKNWLVFLGCLAVASCAVLSRAQLGYWQNSTALDTRALACAGSSYTMHNNFGTELFGKGLIDDAQKQFEECLRAPLQLRGNSAEFNLGAVFEKKGDFAKALEFVKKAALGDSTNAKAHFRAAELSQKTGDDSAAICSFKRAVHFKPDFWEAFFNLGVIMLHKDSLKAATGYFSEAAKLNPPFWPARHCEGLAWEKRGDFQRAFVKYLEAIELCKGSAAEPYASLGVLIYKKGKLKSAKDLFSQALGIAPFYAPVYCNRAAVYFLEGNLDSAEADYLRALRIMPDLAAAHKLLAELYNKKGMKKLAAIHFKKAQEGKHADEDPMAQAKPGLLPFSDKIKK
jgi:protein O-mannosyl-transferase